MTPASGSDLAMTNNGIKTSNPVPRLLGWTTTLVRCNEMSSRSHHDRCASVTTATMRSRELTASARCSDRHSSESPPLGEQYCVGIETPCTVVVTAEKATLFVRVISLLGAAFPDGVPTPRVVFEVP